MTETKPQIKTFWLVLNYSCNNRCTGCYAQQSDFTDNPMEMIDAKKIMKLMAEAGAKDCLCIGGEPTLYHDLIPLIETGTKLGLEMKLVTNGRKLGKLKYLRALVNAGLQHVSISIEGSTATSHNSITHSNSFKVVIAAINNCIELGLSFNTLFTISQLNAHEIIATAELLHKLGAKNILYNIGLPSDNNINDDNKTPFCLSPKETAQIIEQAYTQLKKSGIKVKFFATIPLCLFDSDLLKKMLKDDYITDGIHCHIFYGSGVAFEANGNVIPCTHFVNTPLFNWKKEQITDLDHFLELWYGKVGIHGTFKTALWKYLIPKCETCEYWGKCVGGCPFFRLHFDQNELTLTTAP